MFAILLLRIVLARESKYLAFVLFILIKHFSWMDAKVILKLSKLGFLLVIGTPLASCVYDYKTWGMDTAQQEPVQSPAAVQSPPPPTSVATVMPEPSEPAPPTSVATVAPESPAPVASTPPSASTFPGVPPLPTQKTVAVAYNAPAANDGPAMAAWRKAYYAYDKQAVTYWDRIAQLRKVRNAKRSNGQPVLLTDYVLAQPPVYNGPPRPPQPSTQQPPKQRPPIPKMEIFAAAAKKVYGFTPERPRNEAEFMLSYARAAQEVGFTREQLVAIYAFETGGNGTYDLQAGMLNSNADTQPISTAVGYNQLVATASVSLMWEYGQSIAAELRARGNVSSAAEKARLYKKAQIVDQMTRAAKTVPHRWSAQEVLAKTPAGMGIHAVTLDKDIGPLLQVHKLRTTMQYLRRKGVSGPLTGAELEMLNLTGDGNGYDMVTMPLSYREKVPTSNFFIRKGYERNPVARKNNTVATLLKATEEKMNANMRNSGAQQLYNAFNIK